MKILFGDSGRVDFKIPIEATEEQIEKVVNFFKTIYDEDVVEKIRLDDSKHFREKRLGDKPGPNYPRWTTPENTKLLDFDKIKESDIAEKIGRSETAVYMRRGYWVGKFLTWVGDRFNFENAKQLVEEFMEYEEQQKKYRRNERTKINREINNFERELTSLYKRLEKQKRTQERFPNRMNFNEAIENTMQEIERTKAQLDELLDI